MRRDDSTPGPGTALRELVPEPLRRWLQEGPGWEIAVGEGDWGPGAIEQQEPERIVWACHHPCGLRAQATLRRYPRYGAATLQLELTNPTEAPSSPVMSIVPLCLVFDAEVRRSLHLRSMNGARTSAFYPPESYRERAVMVRRGAGRPFVVESATAESGLDGDVPLVQLMVEDETGPAGLIVALEWMGLWRQQLDPMGWQRPLRWAVRVPCHELRLAPGESLALPTVHLIGYRGDADDGGNACRRYLYDCVCPDLEGRRPMPAIVYDPWFYTKADYDEAWLRRQVDRAAQMGLDTFLLDAGWTAGATRDNYGLGMGNWSEVCAERFPHGLEPFAEYVRARGLAFGLWFGLDLDHRRSRLVEERPAEWFLEDEGHPDHVSLDLSRRDVQEYAIDLISGWVRRLQLRWVRWDNYARYFERLDATGKLAIRFAAGVDTILEALHDAHPELRIERCFGTRPGLDFGTLRRCHSFWTDNQTDDPLVCRFMQCGINRFIPGHLAVSAIPTPVDGGSEGLGDVDILSRMCGTFMCTGNVASWSESFVQRVRKLVGAFREVRHLLVGDFHPLTPQPARPEEGEAVQFASRDGSDMVIFAFAGIQAIETLRVRPRAIDPTASYEWHDPLLETRFRVAGSSILADGLPIPLSAGAALVRLSRLAS